MTAYTVNTIGVIQNNEEGVFLKLNPKYCQTLTALEGFSHINILWWFSDFDDDYFRSKLESEQPYKNAPEKMGIFATRSPIRPNPLALSTVEILNIDNENGVIQIAYTDANDNTPLLDIKPYTPSLDRVEHPFVPNWCSHWPKSLEESATFVWEDEFNF